MKQKPLSKRLSWRIEYAGYRFFETALSLLSPTTIDRLGMGLGTLLHTVSPRYRRLAIRSLRIAFGEELSVVEIRKLALKTCQRTIANFAGTARTSLLPLEKIDQQVSIEGMADLHKALSTGQGAILVLGHMGNWEILNRLHQYLPPGIPAGGVYQPLKNPLVNARILEHRRQEGSQLFSKRDGFHGPASFVKKGGLLIVVADQKVGRGGEAVPFFGRLTSLSPLPAILARKAGAPVLAAGIETISPGRWRLVIRPLPEQVTTKTIISTLESLIRRAPADYLWLHNRWKVDGTSPLSSSSRKRKAVTIETKPIRVLLLATEQVDISSLQSYLASRVVGDIPLSIELLLPRRVASQEHPFPVHFCNDPTPEQLAAELARIDFLSPAPLELALIITPDSTLERACHLAHLPKVLVNSDRLPIAEYLTALTAPETAS